MESIRFPLLLTIMFGRHLPPERLAAIVPRHREVHAARVPGDRRGAAAEAEPYPVATLAFGLAYERALLEWFDNLTPVIRGA